MGRGYEKFTSRASIKLNLDIKKPSIQVLNTILRAINQTNNLLTISILHYRHKYLYQFSNRTYQNRNSYNDCHWTTLVKRNRAFRRIRRLGYKRIVCSHDWVLQYSSQNLKFKIGVYANFKFYQGNLKIKLYNCNSNSVNQILRCCSMALHLHWRASIYKYSQNTSENILVFF